jgi:hypothetical protein
MNKMIGVIHEGDKLNYINLKIYLSLFISIILVRWSLR